MKPVCSPRSKTVCGLQNSRVQLPKKSAVVWSLKRGTATKRKRNIGYANLAGRAKRKQAELRKKGVEEPGRIKQRKPNSTVFVNGLRKRLGLELNRKGECARRSKI